MKMTLDEFSHKLEHDLSRIEFSEAMAVINDNYDYQATRFTNGLTDSAITNDAGTNEGSCKIFAFAKLNQLSEFQALACFGDYYRLDVLQYPDNEDHQNIRNFIKDGWAGITFDGEALTLKSN